MNLSPGLHPDVPAAVYHADPCEKPSLSASIAKILIEKTPRHAWFVHPRLNPDFQPNNDEKFDLGKIVHELALGRGSGIDVLDFNDWRTKAAQLRRDGSRLLGRIPVLSAQYEVAKTIAAAAASRLPHPCDQVHHELVAVWEDKGVICRGMMDCLSATARVYIYDIKTQADISDEGISRVIPRFGYDLQAAAYLEGVTALHPPVAGAIAFHWIFVETAPPFASRVIEADPVTLGIGAKKWARAKAIWSDCLARDSWPGYPPEPSTINYPAWAEATWSEEISDA